MQDSHKKSLVLSISTAGHVLRTQLWIWPILAALILAAVGSWLRGAIEQTMDQKLADELQTILDADVAALLIWFESQRENVEAVADHDGIIENVSELARLVDQRPDDFTAELLASPHLASKTLPGELSRP